MYKTAVIVGNKMMIQNNHRLKMSAAPQISVVRDQQFVDQHFGYVAIIKIQCKRVNLKLMFNLI